MGESLTQSLRTPQEIYRDELAKTDEMLAGSVITQETYNRAIEKLRDDLEKSMDIEVNVMAKGFVEGLQTALGTVKVAGQVDKTDQIAEKSLRVAENMKVLNEAIANNTGRIADTLNEAIANNTGRIADTPPKEIKVDIRWKGLKEIITAGINDSKLLGGGMGGDTESGSGKNEKASVSAILYSINEKLFHMNDLLVSSYNRAFGELSKDVSTQQVLEVANNMLVLNQAIANNTLRIADTLEGGTAESGSGVIKYDELVQVVNGALSFLRILGELGKEQTAQQALTVAEETSGWGYETVGWLGMLDKTTSDIAESSSVTASKANGILSKLGNLHVGLNWSGIEQHITNGVENATLDIPSQSMDYTEYLLQEVRAANWQELTELKTQTAIMSGGSGSPLT
jgi:uncharacterized protein (DUF2164 family)